MITYRNDCSDQFSVIYLIKKRKEKIKGEREGEGSKRMNSRHLSGCFEWGREEKKKVYLNCVSHGVCIYGY